MSKALSVTGASESTQFDSLESFAVKLCDRNISGIRKEEDIWEIWQSMRTFPTDTK